MKKIFLSVFVLIIIFLSCTDRDDEVNAVNIRIQNSTNLFFTEVKVAERDTVFENIAAGDFSAYLEFETAFQSAAITILTDSTNLQYFPTEISSDSLPIGFYTYELSLDAEQNVALTFKIDE
ncbi:MAG: hypothetical protein WA810_02520 [Maribacter sp.]